MCSSTQYRVNAEGGPERKDEKIQGAKSENGGAAARLFAAQRRARPRIDAAANQQRDTKEHERSSGDARGHAVVGRRDPDRDRANGKQQHRGAQEQADRAPYELENPEQVEVRPHQVSGY